MDEAMAYIQKDVSILLKPEQLERIADRIRVNFRNFDKNDIS